MEWRMEMCKRKKWNALILLEGKTRACLLVFVTHSSKWDLQRPTLTQTARTAVSFIGQLDHVQGEASPLRLLTTQNVSMMTKPAELLYESISARQILYSVIFSSTKDCTYINCISVMVLGHAGPLRAKVVANWTCRSFWRTFTSPVPTTGGRRRMRITGGFGSSHQPEDIVRVRMPSSWCELDSRLNKRQTATRDTNLGK